MYKGLFSVVFSVVFIAVSWGQSATASKTMSRIDYANTITADDLKELLYAFASDEMQGRMTGTEGQKKAAKFLTGKLSFIDLSKPIYEQYKQLPVVGFISMGTPFLVVNDLDLVKRVLIKDFDHFVDRRPLQFNEDVLVNKYFNNMLTVISGEKWKYTRSTLSPIFTSGKLKAMTILLNKVGISLFHLFGMVLKFFSQVGKNLVQELEKNASNGVEFYMKELMVDYMLDSICSCGFGFEANSLKNSKNNKVKELVCGK